MLTVSSGEIKILSPQPGIIDAVFVTSGELVKKGQPVARISMEKNGRGGSTNRQIMDALNAQIDALNMRITAVGNESVSQAARLKTRIANQREELVILSNGLSNLDRKVDLAKETFERGQGLVVDGIISRLQLRDFENRYLDQIQARDEQHLHIKQLQNSIADDSATLEKLPSETMGLRQSLMQEISSLREKYAVALGNMEFVLIAKADGKISFVQSSTGEPVDIMQPIATILPTDGKLYAQLYVPSRAIGFVKPGQPVNLMYDAFPYQRFGMGSGSVLQVSSSVLKPSEVNSSVETREPVYVVWVKLSKTHIDAFGKPKDLQPGMFLTADILLERQSIFRTMLEPLYAAQARM
ncbi:MAG TPA: HlyD family efflux transporter periplasmic adaptor subunit [Rhizomicrobium sp.]|nr:HlyD family efflux transporter periplasmic adaptor subunit [Rhizomicrobium sp.]